jgi:hypothetical protein
MTVDEFADILRDPRTRVDEEGFYPHSKPRGYRAILECRNLWYWYSVSGTLDRVSPAAVADAITSPQSVMNREGSYKAGRGFEATIRSGGHSYMLGHGNNRPMHSK